MILPLRESRMICGGHSRVSQRGHLRASRAWASERLLLSRWFTAPPPMCLNAVQQIPFRPAGIFSVNAVLGWNEDRPCALGRRTRGIGKQVSGSSALSPGAGAVVFGAKAFAPKI